MVIFYSRPATSFRWFTSPWKSMRYIIWRNYKWYIIGLILLVLILLIVGIFIYSMPVSMRIAAILDVLFQCLIIEEDIQYFILLKLPQ